MKRFLDFVISWICVFVLALLLVRPAHSENESLNPDFPAYSDLSGYISGEVYLFPRSGLVRDPNRWVASLAVEPEYYAEYGADFTLTFRPFLRVDSADSKRTRGDIREFLLQSNYGDWYYSLGIGKVFWGVAESKHLIDIVNQTDLIESINGEAKLGQPMAQLSRNLGSGFLELFLMPHFRERTFPSQSGRFRNAAVVDTNRVTYDTRMQEWRPDFAARYNASVDNWDLGFAQFYGTSREPSLSVGVNATGGSILIPRYDLVSQTSADIQYTSGAWLWKLEALYRLGQKNILGVEQNYYSSVGGIEHSIYGIGGGNTDLGLLAEYMWDSRLSLATDPLHQHAFFGVRIGLNDEADSQALLGVIGDLNSSTRQYFLEASRRVSDGIKATFEIQLFSSISDNDPFQGLKNDDFARFELAYFY